MIQLEIEQFNKQCAEFLGWKLFNAKAASHNIWGTFEFWEDPKSVYIKNPTKEFEEHLILSNPQQVGLPYDFKLFDDYAWPSTLKFHSNWNLLMDVIDVIENLKFTSETCTDKSPVFTIGKTWCYISINNDTIKNTGLPKGGKYYYWSSGQTSVMGKTKREAVIKAINQFLNWYNNEGKIYIYCLKEIQHEKFYAPKLK